MTRRASFTQAEVVPRLLTAKEGAAYFNLPITQFERLRIGRVCFGTKVLYDRDALDAHLDGLSGLAAQSPALSDNDPEAALDRFNQRFSNAARRP